MEITSIQTSLPSEEIFMVTYFQDGLIQRDSVYTERHVAESHWAYLQRSFPDADVQLHVIPICAPAPNTSSRMHVTSNSVWEYLEL